MADRIKTVSTYNGTSWGSEVPIGADASNVDVTLSNNTKSDLQTVLGSIPSGSSVTERINSKISTSGGDVADTVVSKNINNYDSSTTAGDDILTDTAATMSTNTSTLWSKFNLFRKKVSNNFANYFEKSNLVGSDVGVTSTGDNNTAYTTAAINNYLSNVIGYTSASAPEAGDVATQLSTLNSNVELMPGKIIFFARYTDRVIGAKTNARLNSLNYSVLYNDPEFIAPVADGGFKVFKSMHVFSIHNMLWTAVDNANAVSHVGWGPPSGTMTWAGVTGRCANYADCTHISYNLVTPYGVDNSENYYFKIRNEGAASNTTLGSYFVAIFYCDNNTSN